jgi:hypothetical protein
MTTYHKICRKNHTITSQTEHPALVVFMLFTDAIMAADQEASLATTVEIELQIAFS